MGAGLVELGQGETLQTERGPREFAAGDRVIFLKNERSLGVKNGSLGTLERIEHGILHVRMDGEEDRRVALDSRDYSQLDHGYATTVHKAQGATVDRTFTLATPHFDRHATYVALLRHREAAAVFYASEDFGGDTASALEARDHFQGVLSRARPKDLAHDYLDPELLLSDRLLEKGPQSLDDIDALQQSAAERWLAKQHAKELDQPSHREALDREVTQDAPHPKSHGHYYRGLEDDLDI